MIVAGIDVGSTTTKAVLLEGNKILGQIVIPAKTNPQESAKTVFEKCSTQNNIDKSKIEAIATTGYGRRLANFGDMVITEIKAAAFGSTFLDTPIGQIHTIIDVGGQDTKVIVLDDEGNIEDFAMNDKCAAGTGRFLEVLANKLDLDYDNFVKKALNSKTMIHMNSTCAVFAQSEVISLLARGVNSGDIAAAAHNSIADRIGSMIRRVGQKDIICFTGGGALNDALKKALEENLNKKLYVPENPQTIVALGAAIVIRNKLILTKNKNL
ncbi:acyl-CoA dehydratase activase [bacterium]